MKKLLLIFAISFLIFYPSLFMFFTNDDFFFLKIVQVNNFGGFINFFNILKGPDGLGMYRPLTTQVFFFIGNRNPMFMHAISFLFFFGIIYLIYKLVKELFENESIAIISSFLYAVSATHFGQLYYLAVFQELGMMFFVLLSCLMFLRNKNLLSFTFFILALLCKETAVVTPFLITLICLYKKDFNFKKFIVFLSPFAICLFVYLYIRFRWYGFATGDSYVWDFSIKKLINTVMWYILWSFNLPESLVDFIGPGLKVNPNLFIYWGRQMVQILVLSIIQLIFIAIILIKKRSAESKIAEAFFVFWFGISLLPVVFLPLHKFSFYLTLPMFAISTGISYIFIKSHIKNVFIILFLSLWTITSVLTLKFTYETNWITQSELMSKRIYNYFLINPKGVTFIDTKDDSKLPYSPTSTVRTVLSDKNFFYVFFPNIANNISYSGTVGNKIDSRQFLGY